MLQKIADEREGALKLVKVNIDENQELAGRYGIMSIPTMILFKDGEPAAAAIGARPKGDLERQLGLAEAAAVSVGEPRPPPLPSPGAAPGRRRAALGSSTRLSTRIPCT